MAILSIIVFSILSFQMLVSGSETIPCQSGTVVPSKAKWETFDVEQVQFCPGWDEDYFRHNKFIDVKLVPGEKSRFKPGWVRMTSGWPGMSGVPLTYDQFQVEIHYAQDKAKLNLLVMTRLNTTLI